jgi:hypothetical protein
LIYQNLPVITGKFFPFTENLLLPVNEILYRTIITRYMNPLYKKAMVEVSVPVSNEMGNSTQISHCDQQEEEAEQSTSSQTTDFKKHLKNYLVCELKGSLVAMTNTIIKDVNTALRDMLAEHFNNSDSADNGQNLGKPLSRRYHGSLVRSAINIVTKIGPNLEKLVVNKEAVISAADRDLQVLKNHVKDILLINQSGRMIEVLFNCVQFREAVAIMFHDNIAALTQNRTEPMRVNVYRYTECEGL